MLQIALTEVFSCLSITTKPNREQVPLDELKFMHKRCGYTAQATTGAGTALFSRRAAENQDAQFPAQEGIKILELLDLRSTFRRCIFLHRYLYHTALNRTELGTGALCQPTVIALQYSKSLFTYMVIDRARSRPALFTSN